MIFLVLLQLWSNLANPQDIRNGMRVFGRWQSCLQIDGTYMEKVFNVYEDSKLVWSFHAGPRDEFALFKGDPLFHPHDDSLNLLGKAYHYRDLRVKLGRNWTVPSLKLKVNVIEAGDAREGCESFIILIQEAPK